MRAAVHKNSIDKAYFREGLNVGNARFKVTEDKIRVAFSLVSDSYAWSAFEAVKETTSLFCLMISDDTALIVPKCAFGEAASMQAFRSLAMSRIPRHEKTNP